MAHKLLASMASMALIACMALASCSSPAEKIVKIYEDAIEQLNATDDPHLASEIMDKACDEADEIRLSKDFNPTEEEVNVYLEARDRLRNAHIKALNRKFIREYNSGKYSKSSEPQNSELDYDNNYGGGVEEDENYGDDLDEAYESGETATDTFVLFFAQGTLNLQDVNCVDDLMEELERFGVFDKSAFTEQELTYPLVFDNRVEMADAVENYFETLMPIVKKYLGDMGADLQEAKQDMTEGIYEAKTISDLF